MNANSFLDEYFGGFESVLRPTNIYAEIARLRDAIVRVQKNGSKLLLAGNGASASIASHFALDLTKQAKVRAQAFNDAALITAFGNDYGYERWIQKAVDFYGDEGDLAILISTSGSSENVVNAALQAREMNIRVATLTGFSADNPLKAQGDINLWTPSQAYNLVEATHAFWLGATCDLLIGKSEYGVKG